MSRSTLADWGHPALELTMEKKRVGQTLSLSTAIAFESGVAERGRTKYKLQSFVAAWLGKSGGGGHAYGYDPQGIGDALLDAKKRTLQIIFTANSHLALDPDIVYPLNAALPGGIQRSSASSANDIVDGRIRRKERPIALCLQQVLSLEERRTHPFR
jgi:hypothetical protein